MENQKPKMENENPNTDTPDNVSYEYAVERRYHGALVEVMPAKDEHAKIMREYRRRKHALMLAGELNVNK